MKFRFVTLCIAVCSMMAACNTETEQKYNIGKPAMLTDANDSLSWAYGVNFASTLSNGVFDSLERDVVVQAICHTLEGKTQPMSDTAIIEALQFLQFLQTSSQMQKSSDVDVQQQQYLANLKNTNPNVKEHPSGFFYEVLREGHGPKAKYADRICFDYRSKLMLTGQDYDQSYGQRDSILHVVGKPMFSGLIDGFQLMNAGSIYRFYFPYQLAFGERGSGEIPGYTPFIYEVELHSILKD